MTDFSWPQGAHTDIKTRALEWYSYAKYPDRRWVPALVFHRMECCDHDESFVQHKGALWEVWDVGINLRFGMIEFDVGPNGRTIHVDPTAPVYIR